MWQDQPKTTFLPVETTSYGYDSRTLWITSSFLQRTSYQQPDLYHEEVIELDSPWADIVATETKGVAITNRCH